MPFDPTKPANNSPISSAELRDQFNGLKGQCDDAIQNLGDALADTQTNLLPTIQANAAGPVGGISPLNLVISNPPTQAQVQAMVDRFNQLLTALKRL